MNTQINSISKLTKNTSPIIMKKSLLSRFIFIIDLVLIFFPIWTDSADHHKHVDYFLQCLSLKSPNISDDDDSDNMMISKLVYSPFNTSYSSVLNFTIRNQRFSTPQTPKPLLIITPSHASHVQAAVICSRKYGFQIRTRSGGHDFEGLSYVSHVPFIIVDLINLNSIAIDTENRTAWVDSGATLGQLYYKIAEKSSTLAFPAGVCPTVGVGGHFSGGGYGVLLRKYGLAADHVIDAYLVDVNGKVLDRESMGEDLFWAIRGGGGGSFGIVLAWKVKLVEVPPIVTFFSINRTLEQNATNIIHRWQYVANKIDDNLFIGIVLYGMNSSIGGKRTTIALFYSLFLGKADQLLRIMDKTFPELGLKKEDCLEVSWIESAVLLVDSNQRESLNLLLSKTPLTSGSTKIKSDYVKEPIPEIVFREIWKRVESEETQIAQLVFIPYGGKMSEIPEFETPFSHRAKYRYKIGYVVSWKGHSTDVNEKHLSWIRNIYDYTTPFVSKSPRAAYINYRDLDIGTNNVYGKTSYEQASIWGFKYFGNNFNRLVQIKTKVDPFNFFNHEQSIPSLSPW